MKHKPWLVFIVLLIALILIAVQGQTAATVAAPPVATAAPHTTPILTPAVATPNPTPQTWTRRADGAVMVAVGSGDFVMGSPDGELYPDEHPQHTVYLDAFWIDRTEVTNAQYQRCVGAGTCSQAGDSSMDGDDQPVAGVDWHQATAYCGWAGARLPSEAEWEKAARGTDGRRYPWGNQDATCEVAVMNDGSGDGCGQGKPWPVGSKAAGASPYGALDMAGNVWEWVADWYGADYYSRSPRRNPTGPDSGEYRGLRGGSWYSDLSYVRLAYRYWDLPYFRGYIIVGFRCAAEQSSP